MVGELGVEEGGEGIAEGVEEATEVEAGDEEPPGRHMLEVFVGVIA